MRSGMSCWIARCCTAGCPSPPSPRSALQSGAAPPTATAREQGSDGEANRDVNSTCCLAGITAHLGPVLLLLHGQDGCLRAGGHALLRLLEGRGQANVAADEAHHVVDKRVHAQRAAQVQVRLFVGVRRAVAPLAAQLGSEPGFGQRVRGAVEKTWRWEETSLSDDSSKKGRV